MESGTEIAIKSEHLKQLRGEIDKMESEKAAITDWRVKEEKKVDTAKAEQTRINGEIAQKKAELATEQKKVSDLIVELKAKEGELARQRGDIQYQQSNLEESKKSASLTQKSIQERTDALNLREADIVKRETYIKMVFEGIEKLK